MSGAPFGIVNTTVPLSVPLSVTPSVYKSVLPVVFAILILNGCPGAFTSNL